MLFIVMNKLIEIKNVSKSYTKTQEEILSNLHLTIYENEFVTLGGESGSGKSTLLRILALIDPHFSGEYSFKGKIIHKDNESEVEHFRKTYLGVVFQDFNLIERYTTYRNLELALIAKKVPVQNRKYLIEDIILKVNLPLRVLSRKPEALSGGQRQRIAIARAILSNPSIVVADEPTGSLDDENAQEIMTLLLSLNTTLIIATHDKRIANMSDRHVLVKECAIYVSE